MIVSDSGGGLWAGFEDAAAGMSCALAVRQIFGEAPGAAPRLAVTLTGDDPAAAVAASGRLQCHAAPGEIVISQDIEDKLGGMALAAGQTDDSLAAALGLPVVRIAGRPAEDAAPPRLYCSVPREPSILVLPFSALGGGDEVNDLSEGLRIDIQNALVRMSGMLVIAAASANACRDDSPERAASAMGVRYVLHGVVQVAGERARISLELIDALSASIAWAEQFDRTLDDAFAIQDELTGKVLAALDVKLLSGEQARIWHAALGDPQSMRLFYRGVRAFFRMERDAMDAARRCFEAVFELRPDSPIGYTWAALCHWMDYVKRWSACREESKALARRWADRAAAMPDADGQAQTVMAHMHLIDREFDAALRMGAAAVAARPACANANAFHANVLHYCGRQEEAIRHVQRAIRATPVYPPLFANILAAAYLAAGQPEAAMAVAKEVLRVSGRDLQARLILVAAAQIAGNPGLAALFGREVLMLDPAFSVQTHCADQPYRDALPLAAWQSAWRAAQLPE
jgi:adenylate cyclase